MALIIIKTTLVFMCAILLGCASMESIENTHKALNLIVGSSEERLVAVIGIPDAVYYAGGTKFITYKSNGYIYFLDGHTVPTYCNMTFHIKNNIISDYRLEGRCETYPSL